MEKEETILKLIEKLHKIIDFPLFENIDYWEADLCAIGLKRGNKLVYISTWNYVSKKYKNNEISYDFDFEIIDESNIEKINVARIGRNISETELINEVKLFLEI